MPRNFLFNFLLLFSLATPTLAKPIEFKQIVSKGSPYEGEQLLYRCEIQVNTQLAPGAILEDVTLNGFFREDLGTKKNYNYRIENTNTQVFSIREVIYPNRSGTLEVPQRGFYGQIKQKKNVNEQWGDFFEDLWSDVFDEFNFVKVRVVAGKVVLNVKPLPPRPAGVEGYIPVGNTSATLTVGKTALKSGESIVAKLEILSVGNLRPLEFNFEKHLPKFLKSYPEKPEIATGVEQDMLVQKKVYEFNLIPEFGGSYKVPAINLTYFDPKDGSYKTAKTTEMELLVDGPTPPKDFGMAKPAPEVSAIPKLPLKNHDVVFRPELSVSRNTFLWVLASLFAITVIGELFRLRKTAPEVLAENKQLSLSDVRSTVNSKNWSWSDEHLSELRNKLQSLPEGAEVDDLRNLIDRVIYGGEGVEREKLCAELKERISEIK